MTPSNWVLLSVWVFELAWMTWLLILQPMRRRRAKIVARALLKFNAPRFDCNICGRQWYERDEPQFPWLTCPKCAADSNPGSWWFYA